MCMSSKGVYDCEACRCICMALEHGACQNAWGHDAYTAMRKISEDP